MKKIVILGAGFGGIRAATRIAQKLRTYLLLDRYEVVLIDRNDHHTYTPLLYEVATTSKETANLVALHEVAAYKIRDIIRYWPIVFIQKEITALDALRGDIYLNREKLHCEYLVIALGSEANYYGIQGLKKHSLPLKTFADAIRLRDAVWNLALEGKRNIKILIGGGGPTGVELAAELKIWCGELEKDFKQCNLEVTIIDGAPTVLGGFESRIIQPVAKRLEKLGVKTLLGEKIANAERERVTLASGKKIPFDLLIWTGGVKASSVISKLPFQNEERGRTVVLGEMECLPETPDLKLNPRIYGLGDSICFYDPKTQKPIPGVARAAIREADVVAWNILEDIKDAEGKETRRRVAFTPKEYPYITPVGGKYAVAKIGPFVVVGFLGWILKGLVELSYLLSIMPPWRALGIWLKGLKIFIQNDRLG